MQRDSRLSAVLICVGLALIAWLMSVSSVAAQSDDTQQDDMGGDLPPGVHIGPGTNTGNCPAGSSQDRRPWSR
jgi:hypothetical protein